MEIKYDTLILNSSAIIDPYDLQTAGKSNYTRVANKSFEKSGKVSSIWEQH
jgi:hypothetical protein